MKPTPDQPLTAARLHELQKHLHKNDKDRITSISNIVTKANWLKEVNGTMRGYKACNTTILAYELNWSPKMQKVLLEAAKKKEGTSDDRTKSMPKPTFRPNGLSKTLPKAT